jgi:hypothetical protein
MLHWLIPIGSIVGLITGVYTLYDRVFRQRPCVSLSKSRLRAGRLAVFIRNPADEDIVIIGSVVRPPLYELANSYELDQIIDAALDNRSYCLVRPGQTAEMPLTVKRDEIGDLDRVDQPVTLRLFWRRTGSLRRPRIPLRITSRQAMRYG